jgi:hypothetical protein
MVSINTSAVSKATKTSTPLQFLLISLTAGISLTFQMRRIIVNYQSQEIPMSRALFTNEAQMFDNNFTPVWMDDELSRSS